ncbi:CLUMA_CG012841, isoform A [Clunio marinus]|uniref:CLUMA_CG012841, isoform A n=1 Tax=Clunio marinus TaxID=568069 RepID=A0A1J1IID6_9DIPT|nr:CLUMA_CG012841, isoform A [Clunio marinus]
MKFDRDTTIWYSSLNSLLMVIFCKQDVDVSGKHKINLFEMKFKSMKFFSELYGKFGIQSFKKSKVDLCEIRTHYSEWII